MTRTTRHHPTVGHRVTVLQSAESTTGNLLQIEHVVILPGPHTSWNAGASVQHFITDVRPAGPLQQNGG